MTFAHAGGFGGGYGQMPHAATTYAAVLALAVLSETSAAALELLEEIRPRLYPWLVSLHSTTETTTPGSFRMHHDGEIDVRATYCVVAVAQLLHLLSSSTLRHHSAEYVARCQSPWEGGFGGEPGAEAHGGYSYCAVAALQLLLLVDDTDSTDTDGGLESSSSSTSLGQMIDLPALAGWLSRRQMAFEGGFNGRANKLVDGCYSFWQGGAAAIVSQALLLEQQQQQTSTATTTRTTTDVIYNNKNNN